jgi:hypothetical protein
VTQWGEARTCESKDVSDVPGVTRDAYIDVC